MSNKLKQINQATMTIDQLVFLLLSFTILIDTRTSRAYAHRLQAPDCGLVRRKEKLISFFD